MNNTRALPPACKLARWVAAGAPLVIFLASIVNAADSNGNLTILLIRAGIACWAAAPFLLLGYAQTFRRCPRTTWTLLVTGVVALLVAFGDAFLWPTGSTAALGMVVVPFCLCLLYLVAWVILKLWLTPLQNRPHRDL